MVISELKSRGMAYRKGLVSTVPYGIFDNMVDILVKPYTSYILTLTLTQ